MNRHGHGWDPEIAARKELNVQIFNETMDICKAGEYIGPAGNRIQLPPKESVVANSKYYVNPAAVDKVPMVKDCVIDAVNADCVDVARELVDRGFSPIVLNMANRHTPGGGVLSGCRAQEESLFRQSDLCVSLYQYSRQHAALVDVPVASEQYPMDYDAGGIYSGKVTFFRESKRAGDRLLDKPFTCAVVSVAAINRPELDENGRLVDHAIMVTKSRIRTMLRIGLLHGHDAIVLGAWGCGAFHNPPTHMAELFHEVLLEPEFDNKYHRVRFAVIEDHNSRHSNYTPFAAEFNAGHVDAEPLRMVRVEPGGTFFPERLTAKMLDDFRTTERGCTHPRVGMIAGRKFIAKCGGWSEFSSNGHVHNELVADAILRVAGFNVPESHEYEADFGDGNGPQTIRLAEFIDAKPLLEAFNDGDMAFRARIRAQVIAAYPVQAFMAGIDTFTYDNVLVDAKGDLWFVDNGASFDYRACGKKKGWYWSRTDPANPRYGYLSLARHPHQGGLQKVLGPASDAELVAAAKKVDFPGLVGRLPKEYQIPGLILYALRLADIA